MESISKPTTETLVVNTTDEERKILATPPRRSLADQLAASPKSPRAWQRDDDMLQDSAFGRELL